MSSGPHAPTSEEAYLRVTIPLDRERDCILGVEFRDEDELLALKDHTETVMRAALSFLMPRFGELDVRSEDAARAIRERIRDVMPDRSWFLEVEHDAGTWVQLYYPWRAAHPELVEQGT